MNNTHAYAFDPIVGLIRLSTEEANEAWDLVPEGWPFTTTDANAVYYLTAPIVFGKLENYILTLVVHALPDEHGYAYLIIVDNETDSSAEVFIADTLALLEFLHRYASLITQPLNRGALGDREAVVRRVIEEERKQAAAFAARRKGQ